MNYRIVSKLALLATCFAFVVVVLGAYTRLTDAGLGCPDWPGCYGHIVMQEKLAKTEVTKAWTEMAHRYAAGSLGLIILAFAFLAVKAKSKKEVFPFLLPLILCGLVVFQAMLGMWTVTLKLLPVVVMGHLLGGFSILACLWWMRLRLTQSRPANPVLTRKYQWAIFLGLAILVLQIALGGWVSSNYAGLACVGFPGCNGSLVPTLDFQRGFNLFSPVGANYQGGVLESPARMTIQFVHRIGAIVTACYITALSLFFVFKGPRTIRSIAFLVLTLVLTQFSLGVLNVVKLLPLDIAVAHNAVAALLLLGILSLLKRVGEKSE